jgi:hypothetical protein
VTLDVLEVLEGTGDLPSVDGLGGLAGVLERDTEVGAARAGGLAGLDLGGSVTDLWAQDIVRKLFLRSSGGCMSQCRRRPEGEFSRPRRRITRMFRKRTILTEC